MRDEHPDSSRAASGIPGLDDILAGGFSREHTFLIEGEPGSGKTTLALQFLIDGAAAGEQALYVTMSETERELRYSAASHGWTLPRNLEILELVPPEALLNSDRRQTLVHASELELGESIERLLKEVDRVKPVRIVLDSLSELRLLAQSSLRYRRQVLTLKHHFARLGATVMLLDDMTSDRLDKTVHSVAHGVIRLEQLVPVYGAERRRLRVLKYRGSSFRGGFHDFIIAKEGISVFPRLVATEHKKGFAGAEFTSGNSGLDALLGGGIDTGSSTLIVGPTGTGKSLLGMTFLAAAVARGEKAAIFVFEEEIGLLSKRMKGFGIDVEAMRARGDLYVEQIDAAELTPGEFAHRVRAAVDERGIRTVLIDSLTGYEAAMPEEHEIILHLHEILLYLNRQGVTTFLTVAQHGLASETGSGIDVTFLADTMLLLRYFEADGEMRRAISVVKKRSGRHEASLREYEITTSGIRLGEPLRGLHGLLRGGAVYSGAPDALIGGGSRS